MPFELEGSDFIELDRTFIPSINAQLIHFKHRTSGAQMIHIQRNDDERVFGVALRTPPQDHSGLTHILEHSVLCGSERYPSKEPFVELLKGSLKTFLNAFTYADRTVYPVASCNHRDLLNLADVYLDAIFRPKLHQVPEILFQEGWHYEIDDKTGDLTIQGVVYNEMKGAFSSPEWLHHRVIQTNLLPDTPYRWKSGGDPDHIPSLTYDAFTRYHCEHYNPANALFFYYGRDGVEDIIKLLEERHLAGLTPRPPAPMPALQPPFDRPRRLEIYYPVGSDEKTEVKSNLSLSWAVGTADESLTMLGLSVLNHILTGNPAAPLRKALLEAKVGRDITGLLQDSVRQPYVTLFVKQADERDADRLEETTLKVLKQLSDGIAPALREAALNRTEFQIREANQSGFPRGLVYLLNAVNCWMFGADIAEALDFEPLLNKLRSKAANGYFERLIRERFIDNPHRLLLIQKPEPGLEERRRAEERERLRGIKAGLSKVQIQEIAAAADRLKRRQSTPDNPADIAKIPSLSLSDIKREADRYPIEILNEDGYQIFTHPLETEGIAYLKIYFNSRFVPESRLPELSLLKQTLGQAGTRRFDYPELAQQLDRHTGGFNCQPLSLPNFSDEAAFNPFLVVAVKAVNREIGTMCRLTEEILTATDFDDHNRLGEIFNQTLVRMENALLNDPIGYALNRSGARTSPTEWFNERTGGLTALTRLFFLKEELGDDLAELGKRLSRLVQYIIQSKGAIVSLTAQQSVLPDFVRYVRSIMGSLPDQPEIGEPSWNIATQPFAEAILTPSRVQFTSLAGDFRITGYDYSGVMQVAENLLNFNYLWNRVRLQGGAYGAFARWRRSGLVQLGSYRDPNLEATIEAFKGAPQFLTEFNAADRELQREIIGTIGELDRPLTSSQKGERATVRRIMGITHQMVQQERDEILGTEVTQIRLSGEMLQSALENSALTVVGCDERLRGAGELFDQLLNPITGEFITGGKGRTL